jgi:molybdopterin converting factor small subunit
MQGSAEHRIKRIGRRVKRTARVKLKVVGSPKVAGLLEGDTINAENVSEIVRRQRRLDNYEYTYLVILNGTNTNDQLKSLHDGDEVILVPIVAGG